MFKKILFTTLIIGLFFFGLARFLGLGDNALENLVSRIAYPGLVAQKKLKAIFLRAPEHKPTELINDLQRSLEERDRLQRELIELKAYLRYAENTKELRAFTERYKTDKARIAQILLKNFDGQQFCLVDAGAKQGVTPDSVAAWKDCLVGRVIEVYPMYSKVLLVGDPRCKIAAVSAETGTKGIQEGLGNPDYMALAFVDPLKEIKKDDMVLSSGEGMLFPAGYALGKIRQVDNDGHSYTIRISPCVDLRALEYVTLIPRDVVMIPVDEPGQEEKAAPSSDGAAT